ncbi:MAG: 1-deoxy-D-xylulose-5-phosphate synthase, partial [Desulfobacterales bacterium]|nr:1-deoxy-D-xylulose-5-phosphate synthase [Desulfobacterales bacterium]
MSQFLDDIYSPLDVKQLSIDQLPILACDIRQRMVEVVSKNGGHLASSLGTVELTIALHYVFNTPDDKIIWDVGHQSYAHKLITGRRNEFPTLRKHNGLSGFTKKKESIYDAFTTGHSSNSISVGLGMACANQLKQEKNKVIAVIGDGSMTGGLAYEGLNQAGDADKDIIVILNDNEMSISPNVGALSAFLSRALSAKKMQGLRKEVKDFLKAIPKIGDDVYHLAKRVEESFKGFITPGMLFEAFNFKYFGPINGHRFDRLIDILKNIQRFNEPVLLHVTTIKGKGYEPAEKNPVYFHGVGSFEITTGCKRCEENLLTTYTEVFGNTMILLAQHNPKIVAVTAAMPEGTGLSGFSSCFPDRFFDVGIAEGHGVSFAAGLASEGFKPVVAIYSTFLQRAYDQILHDVCLDALPVVFAIDRGGIVGEDGPTHHGVFDFAYLRSIPNMVVMAPKDENELRRMMVTAIEHNGPIAFRYPRAKGTGCKLDVEPPTLPLPLPIGKAERLTNGNDVLILAIGRTVADALEANKRLSQQGILATVVNARFVKPLDSDMICSLAVQIPKIITIEDHVRQGGFGSAVIECLQDNGIYDYTLVRLGIPDLFVEHGPQHTLLEKYKLDAEAICQAA